MSQIPIAIPQKKQKKNNNGKQQNNKNSNYVKVDPLSVGAGAKVPFQVQLQQLSSKPSQAGTFVFLPIHMA